MVKNFTEKEMHQPVLATKIAKQKKQMEEHHKESKVFGLVVQHLEDVKHLKGLLQQAKDDSKQLFVQKKYEYS